MSEIRDKALVYMREKLEFYRRNYEHQTDKDKFGISMAESIVGTNPHLAIVDRKAEPPELKPGMFPQIGVGAGDGYSRGIRGMLEAGWVKEVKE